MHHYRWQLKHVVFKTDALLSAIFAHDVLLRKLPFLSSKLEGQWGSITSTSIQNPRFSRDKSEFWPDFIAKQDRGYFCLCSTMQVCRLEDDVFSHLPVIIIRAFLTKRLAFFSRFSKTSWVLPFNTNNLFEAVLIQFKIWRQGLSMTNFPLERMIIG